MVGIVGLVDNTKIFIQLTINKFLKEFLLTTVNECDSSLILKQSLIL